MRNFFTYLWRLYASVKFISQEILDKVILGNRK